MSNVEEKQKQTSKWLSITAVILGIVGIGMLMVVAMGVFRDFDARTYTQVILDQTFKGKVDEEAEIIGESDPDAMLQQYEAGIVSFVRNNIINDVTMSDELTNKYIALAKQIFASMKYEVKEAEKVDKREFLVPVEFQPTDLFTKFTAAVAEESDAMEKKAYQGEYKGSFEEINAQMEEEFLVNCYNRLETLAKEMSFGEKETMKLTVATNEAGNFTLDEQELQQFIQKILGLDAIQD